MRIAYIAPYQGRELLRKRPTLRNLALAANVKIELISELLRKVSHDVEIISQGEVIENGLRYYPSFRESESVISGVPVFYASALPIKYLNGWWSGLQTRRILGQRHKHAPFDLVIIYNLKQPQLLCARHAIQRLRLPVVIEYEDDAFVNIAGKAESGFRSRRHLAPAARILNTASGGIGVSPYLLSRFPQSIPQLLLRGVVDEDILQAGLSPIASRRNWVVYSGTHTRAKGLEPMIVAWKTAPLQGWELHIAGRGELTASLERMADNRQDIVFHGLLNRQENARLLEAAKIAINPHDVSQTPGNVFAFKIIEYLAAGTHCITTRMGFLEPELEAGITYMPTNAPEVIAATLHKVIAHRAYESTAAQATQTSYGPAGVSRSLSRLLTQAISS